MSDDVNEFGRSRCMIFRPAQRRLDDGCKVCDRSTVYCAAIRELESRPCCHACEH